MPRQRDWWWHNLVTATIRCWRRELLGATLLLSGPLAALLLLGSLLWKLYRRQMLCCKPHTASRQYLCCSCCLSFSHCCFRRRLLLLALLLPLALGGLGSLGGSYSLLCLHRCHKLCLGSSSQCLCFLQRETLLCCRLLLLLLAPLLALPAAACGPGGAETG